MIERLAMLLPRNLLEILPQSCFTARKQLSPWWCKHILSLLTHLYHRSWSQLWSLMRCTTGQHTVTMFLLSLWQLCRRNLPLDLFWKRTHLDSPVSSVGESSRGNTIRGNRTESLWERNLPLRGPLKTSEKSLKNSANFWKPLETSKNLSKPLNTLSKPSLSEACQRPSQRQISLSEALGPVAPILLPLKLSPQVWERILALFGTDSRTLSWMIPVPFSYTL